MHLEVKAIKKPSKLLRFGQWVLFIILIGVLFRQVAQFDWRGHDWSLPKDLLALFGALILVFPNWWLEWRKWTTSAQRIGISDPNTVRQGFYAGMLSGFLTPSAFGNFIGRMLTVQPDLRPKVVSYTLFGNWAQFNVSLIFGVISLYILRDFPLSFQSKEMNFSIFGGSILSVVFFLFIEKINWLRPILDRFVPSFVAISLRDRLELVLLSALRYIIFSFQFFLLLRSFQPELDSSLWFWIWNLYLWTTFSPALFFGKLFIREAWAVFLLTEAGVELPVALLCSLLIWTWNNALPSLYAYFKWKKDVLV